jgi:hypothetical protein
MLFFLFLRSDLQPRITKRVRRTRTAAIARRWSRSTRDAETREFPLASSRLNRSSYRYGVGRAALASDELSFIVSAARTSTMGSMVPSDTSCGTHHRLPTTSRYGLQDNQCK